jgi:hypothetical protein
MPTYDQIDLAKKILTGAENHARLEKIKSRSKEIIRAKLANGGRPPLAIIDWMRAEDPAAVAAWEGEKRRTSAAKSVADRVAAHVERRSEIGELPEWDDKATIAHIIADPVWACWHYFPAWFTREPSDLTRDVINSIWNVMLHGGYQAIGLHRGGGKSTITKALLLLAGVCGIIHYAVCFGSSGPAAKQIRRDIIRQLETNDRLLADFPAACIPIRLLNGRSQRAGGQTYHGERTYIRYEGDVFQLARIPGAASSGFMLKCVGIESGFLGLVDNGVRPDFVLADDIQSLESAASDDSVRSLEKSVRQGLQGLGGKDNPLRIIILATCTRENDFSDRVLNPEIYPEYSGLRPGLVLSWGKHHEMWEEYIEIWRQDQRDGDKRFQTATAFYLNNRAAMDDGVVVTDPQFYVYGVEQSAIQSAWHLRITMTDAGYFAQIENKPLSPRITLYDLNPKVLARSINKLPYRQIPVWANGITAFSDIGDEKFNWVIKAYGTRNRSAVLDYGIYPQHGIVVEKNMTDQEKRNRIWAALAALADYWSQCVFTRGDAPMRIFAAGLDRGYEAETIQQFCSSKSMSYPFPIIPCRGNGWKQWRPYSKNTIRSGWNTHMVRTVEGYAPGEFINVRTDFWKEVVQRSFLCESPDAPGACSVWGSDARIHAEYFDHLCSEVLAFKGKGAAGVDMWDFRLKPGAQNHKFDATVGCDALAAFYGIIRPDNDADADSSGMAPTSETQNRRSAELQAETYQRRESKVAMEEY